tara:strand:- start:52 stop:267 length:216 start_codon:yes stop_codon:yes gene_type:complete
MKDFDIYKRIRRPLTAKGPYKFNRYIRFNPKSTYEKQMFEALSKYSDEHGLPINTVIKEMVFHVLEEEGKV